MDLQEYLDNACKAARAETLARSDQLTLGELILKLEHIAKTEREKQPVVVYDFEYLFPTSIDSWRGIYAELALNFESEGENMALSDFIRMLGDAVGKTYTGYKGGDFVMSKHTPVWVANYGNSGNTGVVDVLDDGYQVVLITKYCEI